jgi:uncharacterized protein
MSLNYLSIAQQGKNQWWRYLFGMFFILFLWMVVGGVLSISALILFAGNTRDALTPAAIIKMSEESKSVSSFVALNLQFIVGFLAVIVAVQFIHRRSAWSLVSAAGQINWPRLSYGFIVWLIITITPSVPTLFLSPGEYKFHFNIGEWPVLFISAMTLTPIQTSFEEIFFRGYIMQGMGLLVRQPLFLVISNGILFMLPHLANPEIANGPVWMALQYFSIGVFLAFITLQDNRLELALGVHASNNISHIFFTTTDSAMGVPALWTIKPSPAGFTDIALLLVSLAIAYYFFFHKRLWS